MIVIAPVGPEAIVLPAFQFFSPSSGRHAIVVAEAQRKGRPGPGVTGTPSIRRDFHCCDAIPGLQGKLQVISDIGKSGAIGIDALVVLLLFLALQEIK